MHKTLLKQTASARADHHEAVIEIGDLVELQHFLHPTITKLAFNIAIAQIALFAHAPHLVA